MAARSPRTIRVASVPAAHPYVMHLGDDGVARRPDPQPPGAPPGRWWPPVMVDPAWVRAHADAFEVMHLHFGIESFTAAHLTATVAALRAARRPLVFTVHDLTNPQLTDQGPHVAQLDTLIAAADALVTLTQGAAEEIERRWGRRAVVIAHPHVLAPEQPAPAGRPSATAVVGLHLRDLRPNVDGPGATATLIAAVAALRHAGADVRAHVTLHDRVREDAARDAVRRLCADADAVTLAEEPRPDDARLVADLADLDACVLPYTHGTHSGWVELCWDLGVPVAAPAVGHVAGQHLDPAFLASFPPGQAPRLAAALAPLVGLGDTGTAPARPGSAARVALQARRRAERAAQAPRIAAAQLAVYRGVLER